ncbi:hypothetical protein COB11_04610 [Candidatus Aerophobetes bacterium]|uniref:Uncharacterized protein n=1 Tax=Aerophobetes bacterium TaxID=2030807 RepID=A0A2A4YGZ3_UNCAE|nr:MAG: hypothetical protein COB11_04610 [Candidatus Aerophobetes bacterium]
MSKLALIAIAATLAAGSFAVADDCPPKTRVFDETETKATSDETTTKPGQFRADEEPTTELYSFSDDDTDKMLQEDEKPGKDSLIASLDDDTKPNLS